MAQVMMACGHSANAVNMKTGEPSCAYCVGLTPNAEIRAETPNLEGRMARCGCGRTVPSSLDLPFFEWRGDGSYEATHSCKHCGYFESAHKTGKPHLKHCEHDFEPRGDFGLDAYYCGHAGWD